MVFLAVGVGRLIGMGCVISSSSASASYWFRGEFMRR